ncbi:unannotated protein [freshwater metagenome]|uniref:Unannotated protein n=1 Tax=freshwater metagenome TaxID=449393 RepID=A0A6J7TMC8_9ZZZZ
MVSEPIENGSAPDPTIAAEPPLDPPALSFGFTGLLQSPVKALAVTAASAPSAIVVVKVGIAPSSRSRETIQPSWVAGTSLLRAPDVVTIPLISILAFTPKGIPSIADLLTPFALLESASNASTREYSILCSTAWCTSIVRRAVSTSSREVTSPASSRRIVSESADFMLEHLPGE